LVVSVGSEAVLVCAAMFCLSLFYSVERRGRRGKEVGGVDAGINALGTGLLTILLGASAASPLEPRHWLWGFAFSLAIFGGFPTTQIFQLQPGESYDSARNYTSLVGEAAALRIGAVFFGVHVAVVGCVLGATPPVLAPWRVAGIAVGCVLALGAAVHSWRWARQPHDQPEARMQRQMTAMLLSQTGFTVGLWGLTSG
jgi:4-hydroxybenzoate polyprenyltransferase